MRTVVLETFGGTENFKDADRPLNDPPRGWIRVQVSAASINPVDFKTRKGLLGGDTPLVLGFDFAGTVDATGEDVSRLAVGDEVFGWVDPEGPSSNGAYAEYVTLPEAFAAKKPGHFSFPEAAAMAMVGLTAYQCTKDKAALQPGEPVFIAGGSGAVGSVALQLARYMGAGPILTTAGTEESTAYLTGTLGIPPEHILHYKGLDLEEMKTRIKLMNGGRPVRAAFDFVGGDMKRLCFEVIDFDQRVVSIVEEPEDFSLHLLSGGESPLFARSGTFHFQLLLARSRFGADPDWRIYAEELQVLSELCAAGHIQAHRIIMLEDFSAVSVRKGHERLEGHHVPGKLVLPVATPAR